MPAIPTARGSARRRQHRGWRQGRRERRGEVPRTGAAENTNGVEFGALTTREKGRAHTKSLPAFFELEALVTARRPSNGTLAPEKWSSPDVGLIGS